ncbi:uncharacterized protein DEA37_0014941 [Paragonimus westermani]|uniref:Uncharacterized protein n=1 Tax=Paragonimus westermani TaxID=34504 RepID=A0A5J4NLJ6_9TREM|nr:uncharacterized protein DEA37_0014941 [Paragonimus westermani]
MRERSTVYQLMETNCHDEIREGKRLVRFYPDPRSQIDDKCAQTILKRFYAPSRRNKFGTIQSLRVYISAIHKTANLPILNGLPIEDTLLNDDLYQEVYQGNSERVYNYSKKTRSLRSFKNCKTRTHLGKRSRIHSTRSITDVRQLTSSCLSMTQRNLAPQINNNAKVSETDDSSMRGHRTEKLNERKRKDMSRSRRFQKHMASNSVKAACIDSTHAGKSSKLRANRNNLVETMNSVRNSRKKRTKSCKLCLPNGRLQRDLQMQRICQSSTRSGRKSAVIDSTKNNTVSAGLSRKRAVQIDQFSNVTERQMETSSADNVLSPEYSKLKHSCKYLSWLTHLLKTISRLSRYMIRSHIAAPPPHIFLGEIKNQNVAPMEVDGTVEVADFTTPCLSSCSHSSVCEERENLLVGCNSPHTTSFGMTEDNSECCDANHAHLTKVEQSNVSPNYFPPTIRSMRADIPKEITRIAKEVKFYMRPQLATSECLQTPVTNSADNVDNQYRGNASCNCSNMLSDTPTESTQQSNNNAQ